MLIQQRSRHLTDGFTRKLAENIRRTHSGQAHFAGTGPAGAACGFCVFWGYTKDNGRKVHACAKFRALTGQHGPVIPSSASACRYFEPTI